MEHPTEIDNIINTAFEQNFQGLFRYCLACLDGDEQAAMDAVDNVFIITREKARVFEKVKDKKRWLFTTARNTVRNIQRTRRSYRKRHLLFEPTLLSANSFGEGTPLQAWEKKIGSALSAEDEAFPEPEISDEDIGAVKELLLQSLNEDERSLIIARYTEGASLDELSRRLGISKDAVRMRAARASIKLIERAWQYFDGDRSL